MIYNTNVITVLKNTNQYPDVIEKLTNKIITINDITIKELVILIRNKQPIRIDGEKLTLTEFFTIMNICQYEGVNNVIINNESYGGIPSIFLGNLKGSYCFSNNYDVIDMSHLYYDISYIILP